MCFDVHMVNLLRALLHHFTISRLLHAQPQTPPPAPGSLRHSLLHLLRLLLSLLRVGDDEVDGIFRLLQ